MENEEIELLDPVENWEKNIPLLADVVSTEVPVQRIIINNEEQVIMGEACALICPECRVILQQFQPGVSEVDILKSLCTDDEKQLNHTIRCKKCGHLLKVFRPIPLEADYEFSEVSE